MGRPVFIEKRHEVDVSRRVLDIRPFSVKATEWLSDKTNYVFVIVPILAFAILFPATLLLAIIAYIVVTIGFAVNKNFLPYRYPVNVKDPNEGKMGTGIFYMGHVRTSNPMDRFKQIWLSDDDLRKHMLILGSTGSGKSETLKSIFFNALAWSSGFFIADGKADSKLPNDVFAMANSFGRTDDLLILNFLLGGSTPEQIRMSRRRRGNKINPFSSADADTIIQMMSNMLPKVEGEGKNWQEKALNLLRSLVYALCYKRDTMNFELSVSTFIDYLALPKIEELYIEGYDESLRMGGVWSHGYNGIKAYLESGGCPGFKIDKVMAKFNRGQKTNTPAQKSNEQESQVYEQHSYRSTQLLPVMNLLDKTYGFIFRDKYPEIDMIDVTLNNRILVMLIPSLEKSAQEAENLGKLAIACLRVMMGKNLGSEVEGTKEAIQDSKVTNAPYPYVVALDELGYYFADGIAVMFAQARSLGFCMIAAAQDLKKLTEGAREAEAGAMVANTTNKFFMRIDEVDKTMELVQKGLGKATVATPREFRNTGMGWERDDEVSLQEVDRASTEIMQKMKNGEGILNAAGHIEHAMSFYIGKDLAKYPTNEFFVNRFLQVPTPNEEEILINSVPLDALTSRQAKGDVMLGLLRSASPVAYKLIPDAMMEALAKAARSMDGKERNVPAFERGVFYFEAARKVIEAELAAAAGKKRETVKELPPEVAEEMSGAHAQRAAAGPSASALAGSRGEGDSTAASGSDRSVSSSSAIDDLFGQLGRPDVTVAAVASMSNGSNAQQPEEDEADPLRFLDTTFQRKPASSVLHEVEAAADTLAAGGKLVLSDGKLFEAGTARQVAEHYRTLFENRRMRPVKTVGASQAAAVPGARIFDVLIALETDGGADKIARSDAEADWIGQAVEAAGHAADLSSDNTLVGFKPEVVDSIVKVEELLGSADPKASARQLESVVAAQVTPNTRPVSDIDRQRIDAVFDSFTF